MIYTVVNFLPYATEERKPGLIPERYYIPAAEDGKPGILHVQDAHSNLYVLEGKTYRIPHIAQEVAEALCNDYNRAQLEGSEDAHPALFCVEGKHSADDILNKFKPLVEEALKKQRLWFTKLVRRADDDWARWQQHRMITDIQRYAARQLGLVNKAWYHTPEPIEFVKCPACATLVEKDAAICKNCHHVVDKEKAKELGIGTQVRA